MAETATPREGSTVDCKAVAENEIIERYFARLLSEAESEAFERHFFECNGCSEALKDHAAVRAVLSELPRTEPAQPNRLGTQIHPWWLLAAAALALGLGLVLWLTPWNGPPPSEAVLASSVVEAPPYEPRTLRSVAGGGELRFREAMTAYQGGAYAEAIPGLEAAVEMDPGLGKAHFYLGACYLLEDQPDRAIDSLSRATEMEDLQYREWAHFYRAKAHLRIGDLESARRDLSEVIRMDGELQTQAQEVLEQFPD